MKKLVCLVILVALLTGNLLAQDTIRVRGITMEQWAPNPMSQSQISATYAAAGAPGSITLYYWVAVTYPIGTMFPVGPVEVRNTAALGGANTVSVDWPTMAGATSYTVVRTTTPQFPTTGACVACALVVAAPTTILVDNGAVLVANFQTSGVNKAEGTFLINNRDFATPVWQLSGYPISVTSGGTAGLGGVLFQGAGSVITADNSNFHFDDTNNLLGIGVGTNSANTVLQARGATGSNAFMTLEANTGAAQIISSQYSNDADGADVVARHARGVIGTELIVQNGDELGAWRATGWDGTDFVGGAEVSAVVSAVPGAGDMPTDLVFSSSNDGAVAMTERARLPASGGLLMPAVTFATLPASTNGTLLYCSDCDPAAAGAGPTVCTGAGAQTGAFAFRLNGAWTCLGI